MKFLLKKSLTARVVKMLSLVQAVRSPYGDWEIHEFGFSPQGQKSKSDAPVRGRQRTEVGIIKYLRRSSNNSIIACSAAFSSALIPRGAIRKPKPAVRHDHLCAQREKQFWLDVYLCARRPRI